MLLQTTHSTAQFKHILSIYGIDGGSSVLFCYYKAYSVQDGMDRNALFSFS